VLSKPFSTIPNSEASVDSASLTLPGPSWWDWTWKTFLPKFGSVTCWTSSPLTPIVSSASRTPSSSVGFSSATVIRVPDSKSIPKLSCWVASARAPTRRITPDIEKNQRLAPMKSKCQRLAFPVAPSAAGERSNRERLMLPSSAWVKTTAVSSETIVPTPRVKAKPLTPAVARTKRMKAVSRVTTLASMIVAIPRL
jgi:hypothetical protein